MSTIENFLDTAVSDSDLSGINDDGLFALDAGNSTQVSWHEPGYQGTIDYRIRQLSYSSLLTLHSCPRKFQLNRLRSSHRAEEDLKSRITFAFGHVIGEAIQNALQGLTLEQTIWNMFIRWKPDLRDCIEKDDKSFWYAVFAVQKFYAARSAGLLQDYELVYYNEKPACELSFAVNFPDGFRIRGFVDAVLRHKVTGEILILECKTTNASTLNPATYKNSSQAIGYSVVLDHLYPDLSSYKVMYFVYQSKVKEFTPIPFTKTYQQRAQWVQELVLDIESIKMYEAAEIYPMRGESCVSFNRECEYLQTCTLSTSFLTRPCTPEEEDTTEYQVNVGIEDLIATQLKKVEA